MEADFVPDQLKKIVSELTQIYLDKIRFNNDENLGIFKVLQILYQEADLKELGIFLTIAEYQALSTDKIVDLTSKYISKSTIYRKLPEFERKGLIKKNEINQWTLGEKIKTLGIIAELSKIAKSK